MSNLSNSIELSREQFTFAGTGEVFSFTTIQDIPASFATYAPYVLALIKLDEGTMVTAQLTDIDGEINIGDRVEMVTRKLTTEGDKGMIVYGYKFRKILTRT